MGPPLTLAAWARLLMPSIRPLAILMPRPNQQPSALDRKRRSMDQEEHPAPLELGRRMEIDAIFDAR